MLLLIAYHTGTEWHMTHTVPVISKISNYFQYNKENMCIIAVYYRRVIAACICRLS